jgi:hypothetical protein
MHDGASPRTEGKWLSMRLGSSGGEVTNCLAKNCPRSRARKKAVSSKGHRRYLHGPGHSTHSPYEQMP